MDAFIPKHKRDGNEKILALYSGVAHGGRSVTTVIKPSLDRNRMEATKVYSGGLSRGTGGRIAVLVLGGMETTLDEMEYILEAKRDKPFIPKRSTTDILAMCRMVADRRNEQSEANRKRRLANPSEVPKKRRVRLHLPVGFRYVGTSEPGLQVLARV